MLDRWPQTQSLTIASQAAVSRKMVSSRKKLIPTKPL